MQDSENIGMDTLHMCHGQRDSKKHEYHLVMPFTVRHGKSTPCYFLNGKPAISIRAIYGPWHTMANCNSHHQRLGMPRRFHRNHKGCLWWFKRLGDVRTLMTLPMSLDWFCWENLNRETHGFLPSN